MRSLLIMAAFAVSGVAFAGDVTSVTPPVGVNANQSQGQTSQQTSESRAVNSGVNQNIVFTSPPETTTRVDYSGTQTIKNAPSMGAPSLTSANDTCHGTVSAVLSVPGIGIGGGKTYVESNCKMLNNARMLYNMRMGAASLALMCTDGDNHYALEVTGYDCPISKKEWEALRRAEKAEAGQPVTLTDDQKYSDPIIRKRLGLD